ncbi:hypothetical protein V6N13_006028 [Hibiscus sabdariffa]|uniref:Uncharacterized protein n=1 Tax=Hibiscus sabdariffa TaxID=183260 RepID=A0ABR2EPD7_9ROSI
MFLEEHISEKSLIIDCAKKVGENIHLEGENHATSSNNLSFCSVGDPGLLDVPISLEANMAIIGDGIAVGLPKDLGSTGYNPQARSISHESRLQEVQVNVLDHMNLVNISQSSLASTHDSNKHFGLRAGLDKMYWWASAFKDS